MAPGITSAVILFALALISMAFTPPMLILVGLDKLLPEMVTKVPTVPEFGEKDDMVGACAFALFKALIVIKKINQNNFVFCKACFIRLNFYYHF
jgi:hypothetical protein